jgi:hypothetical protein
VNSAFGFKDVSISNLNKIMKLNFPEYDVKKPRDNFARCSTCDRLHFIYRVQWHIGNYILLTVIVPDSSQVNV